MLRHALARPNESTQFPSTQEFYEATALVRCRGSCTNFLRLCSTLEAFDLATETDQSALDSRPCWPLLDEEAEWDRKEKEASAAEAEDEDEDDSEDDSPPPVRELHHDKSWFEYQRQKSAREEGDGGSGERENWVASAISKIDQVGEVGKSSPSSHTTLPCTRGRAVKKKNGQ